VKLQLTRDPKTLPRLKLNPNKTNIFDFVFDDIIIEEYNPHPHIRGEISI
jgi:thymidylate synthase